jgi:NADPH-dependent 2,4-dienoyl-CoA reductase/sulfur reductase-like enzyme/nitrite reductase/ring-hydroxylating ferredoxin subunit
MTDAAEKPDLTLGVSLDKLPATGGTLAGRVGDDEVVLVREGASIHAIGAHCTHYHGPLADGLVVDGTIRCPWHHACFNLATGEPVRAPAFDPIGVWRVERAGDLVFVRERLEAAPAQRPSTSPSSIVIVGGGAAGYAAADLLRRDGYGGPITMISRDTTGPVDRPNLSKDFLAGTAQADWIPMRPPEFYTEQRIDLVLNAAVSAIDLEKRQVATANGTSYPFDRLLLATGAEPVRLNVPGAARGQVKYLRTFDDSRALVERAASGGHALVIGASFIGLEVAASLRTRGLAVDVVAPDHQPLERVMGPDVGGFIRSIHERHGVTFHLGTTVARVDGRTVTLGDGTTVEADLIVAGVGVRPVVDLAERAGLAIDRGVVVNEFLETSAPGVFAAGDIARWPDPHTGERIRVEHWVLAERQGQTAARNMLGRGERFEAVPFFWSQHYDVTINYTGHAERWDRIEIDGHVDQGDCAVSYVRGGRVQAVVTIGRDLANLEAEARLESLKPGAQGPG